MAIGTNTYGTVIEVAAVTPQYTDEGVYTPATRPTLTQVETFLDRVSGVLNVALAQAGFAVPVTQADAALALDEFAVEHAAYLCQAANRAGPYFPDSRQMSAGSAYDMLRKAALAFVKEMAAGIEALGVTRTRHLSYGLQCRTADDGGDAIVPPFQRGMIGNEIVDWDE